MNFPDATDEVARVALAEFTRSISSDPFATDRSQRNLVAMRRAIDAVSAHYRSQHPSPKPVTRREYEILKLLSEGKTYKQIALDEGLAESTVRTHLHHIYKVLGVRDRGRATYVFLEGGFCIDESKSTHPGSSAAQG